MPPSRVHRNTAWDVSFPGEAPSSVPEKRKIGAVLDQQPDTRLGGDGDARSSVQPAQPVVRYSHRPDEVVEQRDTIVLGEDFPDDDDDDDDGDGDREIPIRLLSDFCIFDTTRDNAMVSLLGELDDLSGRNCQAAGIVMPYFLNEEDAGQEEDDDEDDVPLRLRLSKVDGWTIDYAKADDPIYIKTQHAWYILVEPSREYRPFYRPFYRTHKMAQIVLSSALEDRTKTYRQFIQSLAVKIDDILRGPFEIKDIEYAKPLIAVAVAEQDNAQGLLSLPLIRHILEGQNLDLPLSQGSSASQHRRGRPSPLQGIALGNLDLAVLRPENQNQTQITPLISMLATGLFQGQLAVVGAPLKTPTKGEQKCRCDNEYALVVQFVRTALEDKKPIRSRPEWRRKPRSPWLNTVRVGDAVYSIGDVVVVPIGEQRPAIELPNGPEDVPPTARIADYFWFGKIVFISGEYNTVHIRWFEHSSKTFLGEISDARELFLTHVCDTLDLQLIAGKVSVVHLSMDAKPPPPDEKAGDYFCK
ncbi:hypothetical protein EW146_g8903 [Bondarzewia mesenterica]|uniref:BAH domain-containing protein n=1 Tax=Bondarzewia mesenterica TaxID=1095465 RepID=A0A4S4LCH9_9AGAM|nr:hypothetical protein EW146_g8903 [Bondarzewia mesenterica]